MDKLIIHGKENIVKPGFYMPNRISIAAGRALHQLLDGKVCYLVDPTFPPSDEIMNYLKSHDGCAGSSAVKASASERPKAFATPSP